MIKRKNIKKAVVLFDADDGKKEEPFGEKLAVLLSGIIKEVEYIKLDKGDPADLNDNEVKKIKEIIL